MPPRLFFGFASLKGLVNNVHIVPGFKTDHSMIQLFSTKGSHSRHRRRTGRGRGGGGGACPSTFLQMVFFVHANARHSKPKVASRCRHAANIAFDLFNIFLYVIARKVRKCPLSPFVTSNVFLSCLLGMADILARLAQKADSLSALQLTGTLWYSLSNTHPPHSSLHPASAPHFLDRSAAPAIGRGFWKFNTSLLKDLNYVSTMRSEI